MRDEIKQIDCVLRKSDTGEWVAELTGFHMPHFFTAPTPVEAMRKAMAFVELDGKIIGSKLTQVQTP